MTYSTTREPKKPVTLFENEGLGVKFIEGEFWNSVDRTMAPVYAVESKQKDGSMKRMGFQYAMGEALEFFIKEVFKKSSEKDRQVVWTLGFPKHEN